MTLSGLAQSANQQAATSVQAALPQGLQEAQLAERSLNGDVNRQSLILLMKQGVDINEYLNCKQSNRELVSQNAGHNPTQ